MALTDEVPEAFAVEDADSGIGCEPCEKLFKLLAALGEIAGAAKAAVVERESRRRNS